MLISTNFVFSISERGARIESQILYSNIKNTQNAILQCPTNVLIISNNCVNPQWNNQA